MTQEDRIINVGSELQREAELIYEELGITTEIAIQMFFKATIRRHGLPFDLTLTKPEPVQTPPAQESPEEIPASKTERKELFTDLSNELLVYAKGLAIDAKMRVKDAFDEKTWDQIRTLRMYGTLGAKLSEHAKALGLIPLPRVGNAPQEYRKKEEGED